LSATKMYDTMDGYVRTILGCAINILLLQLVGAFMAENTSFSSSGQYVAFLYAPLSYVFVGLTAILFAAPLILSLFLSKTNVESENLRIVPPLFISLVGAAYALVFLIALPYASHATANPSLPVDYLFGSIGVCPRAYTARPEDSWPFGFLAAVPTASPSTSRNLGFILPSRK